LLQSTKNCAAWPAVLPKFASADRASTTTIAEKWLKLLNAIALHRKHISELRSITCHMGSESVTCHPTQVKVPRLNPSQKDRCLINLSRRDGRLSWPRQYGLPACRQSPIQVTPAWHTSTSSIKHNTSPLCYATNPTAISTAISPYPQPYQTHGKHRQWLGGVTVWCRMHDRVVLGSTPGWVTIKSVTICGEENHLSI